MLYIISKSFWRKRWHVWEVGHNDGEYTWVASFRTERMAAKWVDQYFGRPAQF